MGKKEKEPTIKELKDELKAHTQDQELTLIQLKHLFKRVVKLERKKI